jgi:hypothetical protein
VRPRDAQFPVHLAVLAAAAVSVVAGPAIAYVSVDERELGRTDPRRAAFYSGLLGNFSETYTDGSAIGFTIGMSKAEALDAAVKAKLIVQPDSWGDYRAGGASLYTPEELRAQAMSSENFYPRFRRDRLTADLIFDQDRLRSISVRYYNNSF